MLEIKTVSWQNFLSYGPYKTTLDISNLGQCLITGEVLDDDASNCESATRRKRSNGAGKSTLVNVIQWILFGRTTHAAAVGDKVINWFTGKDCWGCIELKNGDTITRTRNTDGQNEVRYIKGGDEHSLISDTISTSNNQQLIINREFGLDWEIFCGSVFFSQYGKPWMEMAESSRKKALERILHIDRLVCYAKVAKDRIDRTNTVIEKFTTQIATNELELNRLETELERVRSLEASYDGKRQERIQTLRHTIATIQAERESLALPDLVKLQKKWDIIAKAESQVATKKKELDPIRSELATAKGELQTVSDQIARWRKNAGKTCTNCEQPISGTHIENKLDPLLARETASRATSTTASQAIQELLAGIQQLLELINSKKPGMTMLDANSIHKRNDQLGKEADRLNALIAATEIEPNPYTDSIAGIQQQIVDVQARLEISKTNRERSSQAFKYHNYIYRSYNDRNKIKSLIFQDHMPFINSRLNHYLDVFGLDIKISLTDTLSVASNLWDYQFESGGERKRTDVAFMLATYDFHEHIYGRQSNFLVLDEVDSRLDDDGVACLINVIKNDLANRVDSILIISHHNTMRDVFANEIRVIRKGRMSSIEMV